MDRNKRLRSPQEIIRERKLGMVFMLVLMIAGCLWDQARAAADKTEYNPEGSPLPVAEMIQAIKYALGFAWTSRIDVGADYTGLTGETVADGKIIVRWEALPLFEVLALREPDAPGETTHYADLGFRLNTVLGYAKWTTRDIDGSLVRAEIVLNTNHAPDTVDKCVFELLVHEFGHIFRGIAGHSDDPEDVMHATRGECRYSPSLSDLSFVGKGKPLKSCHVELTPHGDLEALDVNGQRISLFAWSANKWALGSLYDNPLPKPCGGVHLAGGEVWAEVKAFGKEPTVLRLKQENGLFRALPY